MYYHILDASDGEFVFLDIYFGVGPDDFHKHIEVVTFREEYYFEDFAMVLSKN